MAPPCRVSGWRGAPGAPWGRTRRRPASPPGGGNGAVHPAPPRAPGHVHPRTPPCLMLVGPERRGAVPPSGAVSGPPGTVAPARRTRPWGEGVVLRTNSGPPPGGRDLLHRRPGGEEAVRRTNSGPKTGGNAASVRTPTGTGDAVRAAGGRWSPWAWTYPGIACRPRQPAATHRPGGAHGARGGVAAACGGPSPRRGSRARARPSAWLPVPRPGPAGAATARAGHPAGCGQPSSLRPRSRA